MTDLVLAVVIGGTVVLALVVDAAVLLGWLRKRSL
jgi:hypothetical protein